MCANKVYLLTYLLTYMHPVDIHLLVTHLLHDKFAFTVPPFL